MSVGIHPFVSAFVAGRSRASGLLRPPTPRKPREGRIIDSTGSGKQASSCHVEKLVSAGFCHLPACASHVLPTMQRRRCSHIQKSVSQGSCVSLICTLGPWEGAMGVSAV